MKNSKSSKVNMFFSAFLICAYLVCSYFISDFANNMLGTVAKEAVFTIIFVAFGLFLFYATRVGDGKPVYRFSLSVLLLMVCPSLYAVLCNFITVLPLSDLIIGEVAGRYTLLLAEVILGYGLPYMFVSGFEMKFDEEEAESENVKLIDSEESEEIVEAEEEIIEENKENKENKEIEEQEE